MTAIAERTEHTMEQTRERTAGTRVWNVVRLQFANRWNMLVVPWLVLAFIFLINYAIWAIISISSNGDASLKGTEYTGATFFIFVYMMVLAVQAIGLTFPFALGYSVTRRDYYLGTSLAFVLQSAIFTAAYVILSYIEEWTNGWGLGGHMFTAIYFGHGPVWQRVFTVLGTFLFACAVGIFAATIYVRWKTNGLLLAGAFLMLVLLGAVALITLTQSWPAVGAWFVQATSVGVIAWLLLPTAVFGAAGFYILRRATPKN
jgi:hypothetical protein